MKIFVGADHRGFQLKEEVKRILTALGYDVVDQGTSGDDHPCDYPAISFAVAQAVAQDEQARGVLLCMSGIGMAIAANKVPGAYAALCCNQEAAVLSRQHNNANILVLGAKFVSADQFEGILKTWLETPFEGGRHERRVEQIKNIEKQTLG